MPIDAAWGLAGALVYAGARLIAQLFGAEAVVGRRHARAWAQFALALFAGAAGGAALTSTVQGFFGPKASPEAVALLIGLVANTLWPILIEGFGRRARIWSGDVEP